jgi:hypothetical protein
VSDHAILGWLLVVSIAIGTSGLLVLGLVLGGMLRECQRLTRAVAGLVYQESEKTRAVISAQPPA